MTLSLFDVIWAWNAALRPPKFKMVVCLDNAEGLFLRINTGDKFRPCVGIAKRDHPFLDHDSYVECSLNVLDEYVIEEALAQDGVIGRVNEQHKAAIWQHLKTSPYISDRDKETLSVIFGMAR